MVASLRRPPGVKHPTQFPSGAKGFAKDATHVGGPGPAPAGFVNGNNSVSEWPVDWALQKICKRLHLTLVYQGKVLGGRKKPGGLVPDFMIYELMLIIRVQTERYHLTAGSAKIFYDKQQKYAAQKAGYTVLDIYEEDYRNDIWPAQGDGSTVMALCWQIVNRFQRGNKLDTFTSRARL